MPLNGPPLAKRLYCPLQHLLTATNVRPKSHSSHSWLERQKKDVFRRMSRYDDYRARSAYKLIQIDDKYKFLRPGMVVLEAGAAPGSWTQVICDRLELNDMNNKQAQKGMCIAVDIAAIEPVEGAICVGNADITSPFAQSKLLTWLDGRPVDCVLSDMAPNCTGQKYLNHTRIVQLVTKLLLFSQQVLRPPSGIFVTKLFDGDETGDLLIKLKMLFEHVTIMKPEASRADSSEMYIICRNFKEMRS